MFLNNTFTDTMGRELWMYQFQEGLLGDFGDMILYFLCRPSASSFGLIVIDPAAVDAFLDGEKEIKDDRRYQ
jgi:hypothetical protein